STWWLRPALEPELLGLLLDVLVVERRPILSGPEAGTDLDGDLLKGRALDRRLELQRGRDVPLLHVGHHVLDRLGGVGRQLAALDHVRAGRRVGPGLDVASLGTGHEGDELL